MKKGFFGLVSTVFVLFLILCSGCFVVFQVELVNATPVKIVIPDDYPLIQDAIDAAKDGDTIFVKNGVYYETLVINKNLTLVGENREHTIIDAHKLVEHVVLIRAKRVTLTNFTLGHAGYISSSGQTPPIGIFIERGSANIIHNTIYGVSGGPFWARSNGSVTFRDNIVANTGFSYDNRLLSNEIPLEEQVIIVEDMPSPFPADIELLEGNQVLHLNRTNGATLGALILKDNATLIIDNFIAKALTFNAFDNSRIVLLNGAYLFVHQVNGATPMTLYLMDNSSLNLTDSRTVNLVCKNNTHVTAKNSTLRYIFAHNNVVVELTNSTSYGLEADGLAQVRVYNSTFPMDEISGEAQVFVTKSIVRPYGNGLILTEKGKLWLINSTLQVGATLNDESTIWFVDYKNATDISKKIIFDSAEAKANFGYYLNVIVESTDGVPLQDINVEVYLPDGTLVDDGTTSSNGTIQFVLSARTWNNQTTESFGSYTVKVSKDWSLVQKTVDLDSNKQITMSIGALDLWIFSDVTLILIILAVVLVAVTLVYFINKRKYPKLMHAVCCWGVYFGC